MPEIVSVRLGQKKNATNRINHTVSGADYARYRISLTMSEEDYARNRISLTMSEED